MKILKAQPDVLRAATSGRAVGVDREKNILRGYVVAQEGPFKSRGRGEFDVAALKKLVTLGNRAAGGLMSRFAHPNESDDGVGKVLGVAKNFSLDSVRVDRDGEKVLLHAVRADLHFDKTAMETPPNGGRPYGDYVMALAESNANLISSSIVVEADQEERLDPKTKRPMLSEDGEPLPPLWRPTRLHASDVVCVGDAVDGLLGAELNFDGLPNEVVFKAEQLLNKQFAGHRRAAVKARCLAYFAKYLDANFGPEEPEAKGEPEAESAEQPKAMTAGVAALRTILAEKGAS